MTPFVPDLRPLQPADDLPAATRAALAREAYVLAPAPRRARTRGRLDVARLLVARAWRWRAAARR